MLRRMTWTIIFVWVCSNAVARGDSFLVTLNTSTLVGPYVANFQLNGGSGLAGNNTVMLSAFDFGGGTAAGAPLGGNGGVTGNMNAPPIMLTDTSSFNDILQQFDPGSY